jgi:hypothetical protein
MVHHLPFGNVGCHLQPALPWTRTIEIDDSIVRGYASDTERHRESYTEVCDVCLSRPINSGRSGLSHPDECSSGPWNTDSSHETCSLEGISNRAAVHRVQAGRAGLTDTFASGRESPSRVITNSVSATIGRENRFSCASTLRRESCLRIRLVTGRPMRNPR